MYSFGIDDIAVSCVMSSASNDIGVQWWLCVFFFQAEDGIRDLVRSRGLGDVYKRQILGWRAFVRTHTWMPVAVMVTYHGALIGLALSLHCLLYTSDAADERSSVDLGGRRIIKKKKK